MAGVPTHPDDLLQHSCLVMMVPGMSRPLDEWEFERADERKVIRIVPAS
jgi:hypothetical protein